MEIKFYSTRNGKNTKNALNFNRKFQIKYNNFPTINF